MGNVQARHILGCIEAEEENIDLAIRHWKLAASAGDERSVEDLWEFFHKGALEKAELEESLRAHKDACDMNSEERARKKLLAKAMDENDGSLSSKFLWLYYNGEINAKQLKAALKVHQTQT